MSFHKSSSTLILTLGAVSLLAGCPPRNENRDTGTSTLDTPTPRADTPGSACAMGTEDTAAACSDGCSNDTDTFIDCMDFDCSAFCVDAGVPTDAPAAMACPGAEAPEDNVAACSDGCSNDGDNFADCDDFDCCSVVTCGPTTGCGRPREDSTTLCSDTMDNDGDTFIDCDDRDCCSVRRDCPGTSFCGSRDAGVTMPENTPAACADGMDNDGDRFIDCDDFGCCAVVTCTTGSCSTRDAGMVGMENTDAACRDGVSNDGDTFIDCEDRDCCSVRRDCGAATFCGMRDAG